MAITAGTTAQGHSDECRARIEQKMLEDVTGEGAMRPEEAIRRKRARHDDESGRADVAMQDPQGVVRTAEEARLQPREELEAAVDSICKQVKELGALHVAESDVGEIFLPGRSAKLGSIQIAPRFGCGPTVWVGPGLGGWSTGVLEDVTCRASRIGDRIAAESKSCTLDQRRTRHFLHEHPWRASSWDLDCFKAVRERPGVVVVQCDQRSYGLVERWLLKEGGWGERQSTQRTGWVTFTSDLARELSEVQGLDKSHELETRAPPCLTMHATERYCPRLVEAISRCLSIHLRRKNGVLLDAVEVGIGPHVDVDVRDADLNETRLPSQKYYDQYTGLDLDPVGAAAARQSEIDFAWRLKSFEPRPWTEAYQRMGRKPFGMRWIDCNKGDEQRPGASESFGRPRDTSDIAAVTSSTPLLEVVRLFCSLMMSMKGASGEPLVLQFVDVSRAYPHAEVLRDDFYVETVPEMGLPEDTCLLARRGWYGM